MSVFWLSEDTYTFPPVHLADPNGLLAIGGDLSSQRILTAYRKGIFPWFGDMDPYLWWSPDPRFVLYPDALRVSKSMRPYFNQQKFTVTLDQHFLEVIRACAESRRNVEGGTWITPEIVEAYTTLHQEGYAHSVEVWQDNMLVGGLYGLSIGKIFFGESMFARVSNASKFGFITLVQALKKNNFQLIDCQQETIHLGSLGAQPIPRADFIALLEKNEGEETILGSWEFLLD